MERKDSQNQIDGDSNSFKKILIIGAGMHGMLAARYLSQLKNVKITVIDSKSEVGGLWVYSEINEFHPQAAEEKQIDNFYKLYNCFQSSMYPHLIANMPLPLMSFKDFSIRDANPKAPNFVRLNEYKDYFKAYWNHFDIYKHITFNTLVKSIRIYDNLPLETKLKISAECQPRTFVVTTIDSRAESFSQNEKIDTYDYVIAASGQHSKPYIPQVKGISDFKGVVMHSKEFREPDEAMYIDKTILVLGGSYSALDMIVQLYHNPVKGKQRVNKLIMCARDLTMMEKSTDFKPLIEAGKVVLKKGWVDSFTENTAVFTDGTQETVDTVIFCTGYQISFPYLDPEDKLIEYGDEATRGKFFGPIYRRTVCIRQPQLFFIGICTVSNLCNYISELQAMLIKHYIEGSIPLPSKEEMMEGFEAEVEEVRKRDGNLINFFRLENLRLAMAFLNRLREPMKNLYEGSEDKAAKNFEIYEKIIEKATEFLTAGDFLQYKEFDYCKNYCKELENTSEFI